MALAWKLCEKMALLVELSYTRVEPLFFHIERSGFGGKKAKVQALRQTTIASRPRTTASAL